MPCLSNINRRIEKGTAFLKAQINRISLHQISYAKYQNALAALFKIDLVSTDADCTVVDCKRYHLIPPIIHRHPAKLLLFCWCKGVQFYKRYRAFPDSLMFS